MATHRTTPSASSSTAASSSSRRGSAPPLCAHIFLAEFDIDKGSALKHQYPEMTGVDEHLLAEHMLPDGAHDRQEDWTVFYLNQIPALSVSLDRSEKGKEKAESLSDSKEELLYVMSVVQTKKDASVRRGALVKALAIATPYPYIQVLKPVLLLALDEYFLNPSIELIETLYTAINGLDLRNLPSLSFYEKLVLRASDRPDLFEEKFPDSGPPSAATPTVPQPLNGASRPRSIDSLSNSSADGGSGSAEKSDEPSVPQTPASGTTAVNLGKRPKDTHFYDASMQFGKIAVPMRFPLGTFPQEIGEYSLIKLVQTFPSLVPAPLHPHLHSSGAATPPMIVLFNALLTHKRVVFLGHGLPANDVASLVLAACALGSGCGAISPEITRRAFPYTNLVNLDNLQTIPGFIAGVCNPAFADRPSWWDVLCNIETGKITLSKDLVYPTSAVLAAPAVVPNPNLMASSVSSVGGVTTLVEGKAEKESGSSDDDLVFMDEIINAIAAHYGEPVIRARFADYLLRFIRQASFISSDESIGFPSRPYSPVGGLGSGWLTDGEGAPGSMAMGRIEGWKASEGYREFQEVWRERREQDPLVGIDIVYQLARLRTSRRMPTPEADLILRTIAILTRTDDQVIAILAHLPPHFGGLLPISFGLFHPSESIRYATLDVLDNLAMHPTGRKFAQALNAFHRNAYYRLRADRPERTAFDPLVTKPLPPLVTQ